MNEWWWAVGGGAALHWRQLTCMQALCYNKLAQAFFFFPPLAATGSGPQRAVKFIVLAGWAGTGVSEDDGHGEGWMALWLFPRKATN